MTTSSGPAVPGADILSKSAGTTSAPDPPPVGIGLKLWLRAVISTTSPSNTLCPTTAISLTTSLAIAGLIVTISKKIELLFSLTNDTLLPFTKNPLELSKLIVTVSVSNKITTKSAAISNSFII